MNQYERLTLLLLTTLAAGCSGGSSGADSNLFKLRSTNVAVAATTPIRVSGAYIAFLAAEDTTSTMGMPGGTILNDDGDVMDSVAHVVNTTTVMQFRLGVAADDLAWAGNELYLVVDEFRDGHDWNNDSLMDDDVLLHWSETSGMLEFVDDLFTDAELSILSLGDRVLYVAKDATVGTGGSNLRFVESTDPLVPIPVATMDGGPSELTARLLGEDEGLVFLALDETLAGRTLNGDVDTTDANVLALLDGSASTSVVRSTARAIDPDSPRRAKTIAAGDWHVGFLVSENGEGPTNLNSSAVGGNFRPAYCTLDDSDTNDDVLAVLTYSTWNTDPVANPPINHGLAGHDRIAFAGEYVATIVSEMDDNCNLNGPSTPTADMDMTDDVVRWVRIANSTLDPILPVNIANQIRALADVPGGGHGLYELSNRFVIVSSEDDGGNIDVNDAIDANLVGWLLPSPTSSTWDFTHGDSGDQYVEATWLSDRESANRLGVAFGERIGGFSLNQGTATNPGDMDTTDSIPTFALFASSRLVFLGRGIALDKDSAGFTIAKGWGFYRVSELADSRDTNLDNDDDDFIIEATNYSSGTTFGLSVVTPFTDSVAVVARFGAVQCAAFVAPEADQGAAGTDFNGDGDRTDFVVRWFRY